MGSKGNFYFWKKEENQKHLYSIFKALDAAAYAAYATTFHTSYVYAAADAYTAAAAAYDAAYDVAYAAYDAAYTAAYIIIAADAAYDAAYASRKMNIDLEHIILEDLKAIKTNQQPNISTILYGEIWDNFQTALKEEGCEYWASLYQDIFNNNFALDEEALARRVFKVPKEYSSQGAAAVGRYLEELEAGAKRLNEARILILGDKGAGKTCVARKLKDPNAEMTTPEESTAGVDTTLWQPKGDEMNIRIWDFAGHTVTHAVHQFFLSERCLYIMVYNGRTESQNRLEYWLDHMKNYGGDSEAIILVNERDRHKIDLPINNLKEKYAIKAVYSFDIAKDKKTLQKFRTDIAHYIKNNPSWKNQEIPTSYYAVKEALEKRFIKRGNNKGQEHIKKEEFIKIAQKHNIAEPEKLLQDLHFLGVSLWYKDIEEVDTLILNPEWISQGVYTIINWVSNKEAHSLTLDCFTKVFKDNLDRYPQEKHAFLFKLMKHYELAYEATNGRLIIPHLLKEDQPEKLPIFEIGKSLMLKYEADQPLPPHTISRFIVRHNQRIKEENNESLVWRYGVILEDGKGSLALVREIDRTISVSISGKEKTTFLTTLRDTLNAIFNSYKSKKPSLKYKIERHGEIKNLRNPQDPQSDIWLTGQDIISHQNANRPYFDTLTGQEMPLDKTAQNYNITYQQINVYGEATALIGGTGNQATKNTFNFHDCNIGLQGSLNELARKLTKAGNTEDAEELTEAIEILDEIKKGATKEEVQKKGIGKKLKRIVEDLGDDKSTLGKTVKGIKNGISIAQDIAKQYNKVANWLMLPQVHPLLLGNDDE